MNLDALRPCLRLLKSKICLWLTLGIVLFCCGKVYAESIYLKSGKTVEGKIVEKTDQYTKIDIGGMVVTYYSDEIGKAEGAGATTQLTQQPVSAAEGELYVNDKYGFKIRLPRGWYKHENPNDTIFFTKQPTANLAFPVFGINIDTAPAGVQTTLDFVKQVIGQLRRGSAESKSKFTLLSGPEGIVLENGAEGVVFTFEMVGQGGHAMKSIDCKFMKANTIISLQGMDYPAQFQANYKDFTDAIGSFRFLGETGQRRAGGNRRFKLTEYLATGTKQSGTYINKDPRFSLNIPGSSGKGWYFTVFNNDPQVPFYIANERITEDKPLPFISSMLTRLSQDNLAVPAEALFQQIALEHEKWEGQVLGKDIKIINKGSSFNLNGLKAFERAIEVPRPDGNNSQFHEVCILIGGFLLQLGLNTDTLNFNQDEQDFMGIVKTLSANSQ
jgi:hypothetical protein